MEDLAQKLERVQEDLRYNQREAAHQRDRAQKFQAKIDRVMQETESDLLKLIEDRHGRREREEIQLALKIKRAHWMV